MKKLSPDITDEELNELFREAARVWPAAAGRSEKDEGWEVMQAKLSAIRNATGSSAGAGNIHPRSKLVMVLLLWAMMVTCWMMQPANKKKSHENKISGSSHAAKSSNTKIAEKQLSKKDPGLAGKLDWRQPISKEKEIISRKAHHPSGARVERKHYLHDAAESERQVTGDSLAAGVMNSKDAVRNPPVQKESTKPNAPASKTKEKEEKQKNKSGYARWAIGLTLGPDWSMVGGQSQTRPGLDKGIMLQYRVSRKWSLETGILLASKIYSARPGDYHSVNSYPNVTGVDATCRVFDLPLNLRYNIWQPRKEQVFVVAGLSSFWMEKESYHFKYDANGASTTSELNVYHQNRHFLSIANLAVGYEHTWGKISAEASPYIKIPLGGIGYGRVKLFSTGVMASIKYNF